MSGEREEGVKWVRPPEFADDLDVSELYERLLEDGEVTIVHEFRTVRVDPTDFAALSAGRRFGDLRWTEERGLALARRAAEDGLRVRGEREDTNLRRTAKYIYWRKTRRFLLDGPLTAELADPASAYRKVAERLFALLVRKGESMVSYLYERHALLPESPQEFIVDEISRLAEKAGLELRWDWLDDHGETVTVVGRRERSGEGRREVPGVK